MMTRADFVDTLAASGAGLTLAELLTHHPDVARRTAQRWISQLIAEGHISAHGEGRARRYRAGSASRPPTAQQTPTTATPPWAGIIPISADSRDILAYVEQAIPARKPVGYQQDFLDSYQPNVSGYLSEPLRKQLHRMGRTAQARDPAGTYSRAILNRLLIDLSWASSHLEGNTYSRLDTRELIEHGRSADGCGSDFSPTSPAEPALSDLSPTHKNIAGRPCGSDFSPTLPAAPACGGYRHERVSPAVGIGADR